MDISIEVINILKKSVDLHVLIEITPSSKINNIVEVNKLPDSPSIIGISELIKNENYKYLEPYFKGCASANFIVHTSKTGFSLSTIKISYILWRYIKSLNPEIIHLEAISFRSIAFFPFLHSGKKYFITIHDSIPHSGENNWKISWPRLLFLRSSFPKTYFFYSEFSKNQFVQYYKNDWHPKYVIRMCPYTFYKNYAKNGTINKKHILFFGSISPYKGIETLLQAMRPVLERYPTECLIIAGRQNEDYTLNNDDPPVLNNNIIFLNRYIRNEELVDLIQGAKFIVCPYLEATQSGVLMTALALNTPVIATNVGAFPEYIVQNVTGMLVPVSDPNNLAKAIISALSSDFYETLSHNIKTYNNSNLWQLNIPLFRKLYIF